MTRVWCIPKRLDFNARYISLLEEFSLNGPFPIDPKEMILFKLYSYKLLKLIQSNNNVLIESYSSICNHQFAQILQETSLFPVIICDQQISSSNYNDPLMISNVSSLLSSTSSSSSPSSSSSSSTSSSSFSSSLSSSSSSSLSLVLNNNNNNINSSESSERNICICAKNANAKSIYDHKLAIKPIIKINNGDNLPDVVPAFENDWYNLMDIGHKLRDLSIKFDQKCKL